MRIEDLKKTSPEHSPQGNFPQKKKKKRTQTIKCRPRFSNLLMGKRTETRASISHGKKKREKEDPSELKTQDLLLGMEEWRETLFRTSNKAENSSVSTSLRFLRRWISQSEEIETKSKMRLFSFTKGWTTKRKTLKKLTIRPGVVQNECYVSCQQWSQRKPK